MATGDLRRKKHTLRHEQQKITAVSSAHKAAPRKRKKSEVPLRAVFARGIRGSDPILKQPLPQIAFVGRSNVGKSSTINALLGVRGLARTSATPGKTQEINFFLVNENTYFVDLPGYGYARLSAAAAERIRKHILWYLAGGEATPKLVILIIDVRVGETEHDRELIRVVSEQGHSLLILLNKIDKLSGNERTKALHLFDATFPDMECIPFSAKTKEGVPSVRARIFSAAKQR